MKRHTKYTLTTLIVLLLTSFALPAMGQDDIYYDPSKDTAPQVKVAKVIPADYPSADSYGLPVVIGRLRDVDEYNRRGFFSTDSIEAVGDSVPDAAFDYTNRIERFIDPDVVINSTVPGITEIYYAEPQEVNIYVQPSWAWGYTSPWYWGYSSPYTYYWGPSWSWSWGWGPSWSWGWGYPSYGWGWGYPSYGWGWTWPVYPDYGYRPPRPGGGHHPGGDHRPPRPGGGNGGGGSAVLPNGQRPGVNGRPGGSSRPDITKPGAGTVRPGQTSGGFSAGQRPSVTVGNNRPGTTHGTAKPNATRPTYNSNLGGNVGRPAAGQSRPSAGSSVTNRPSNNSNNYSRPTQNTNSSRPSFNRGGSSSSGRGSMGGGGHRGGGGGGRAGRH